MNRMVKSLMAASMIMGVGAAAVLTTVCAAPARAGQSVIEEVIIYGFVQDLNEQRVPFARIDLYNRRGNLVQSTVCDEDGNYSMNGRFVGHYKVVATTTENETGGVEVQIGFRDIEAEANITVFPQ